MATVPPSMAVPAFATRVSWERVAHQAFCKVAAHLAEEESQHIIQDPFFVSLSCQKFLVC